VTAIHKKKGLSQADLGKAIGTSGYIIGRYERDEVKPSIEVAVKIADALDISLDYLVGKTRWSLTLMQCADSKTLLRSQTRTKSLCSI
jgi:transcriptional regulator with XRE-family HTH domain